MQAGRHYVFAFYALSTNNVSAPKLLYVANAGAKSITAYALSAQGNAAPVRTIAGPSTGLNDPTAICSDSDGNLVVANASGSIEIFAEGANGNVGPMKTFSVPGSPSAVAVSPIDGEIYVGLLTGLTATGGAVDVFTASGVLKRSVWNFFDPGPPPYQTSVGAMLAVAIDKYDNLLVGYNTSAHAVAYAQIESFGPSANGADAPFASTYILMGAAGPAYALDTDQVFAFQYYYPPESLLAFTGANLAGPLQSDLHLTLLGPVNPALPLVVDSSGTNLYTTDGAGSVFHLTGSASGGFITSATISGPVRG